MAKFKCSVCDFVYDETVEGTKFSELSGDWVCPICGVSKEMFEEVE